MADLIELFEDHDIQYWDSGKNVTIGWINIQCPFCDDESNHLGIRLSDFRCHCWKCGKKNLIRIVKEILNISYREAKDKVKKIDTFANIPKFDDTDNIEMGNAENFVAIPKEATNHFPKMHREYLRSRGFKPLRTIRKYKLKAVYNFGRYSFRIIIPIFKNNKLISFTSRDVTGYGEPKYKHASPRECVIKAKNCIYGYDTIAKGGDAVLVEGVFDQWKLGQGSIASFGTTISGKQMVEISEMDINRLFLFFDNDRPGRIASAMAARHLAPLVKQVEVIKMTTTDHDPGSLSKENAELIMRSLDLR